ncbi:MAG: diaminopimelate epimerase, partial [Burkholderiaceae bacterium]|nr:diaminopimelate epimerase [Burkholderiaceae bacterium]
MGIPFTKMHGAGNDFIVLDARAGLVRFLHHLEIEKLTELGLSRSLSIPGAQELGCILAVALE